MSSNSAIPSAQPSQSPNPPPSSAAPPPSSAAPPPPSSNTPAPPPSSNPPASSPPKTSAAPPPVSTQVVTAPAAAPSTEIQTSIILVTASPTRPGDSVVVITSVLTAPPGARPTNVDASGSAKPTSTNPTEFQNAKSETSGLSPGGKTAIAVVIPVIAVALLVLGALFFWRKRKQRKTNEDERRKEVEEYGFNPNHDPTLPAVGMAMAEDESGYRGWGNTNTSSKGKASTTLTSGMTYSDSNSNPGGYANPNSPTHGTYSEANPNDPLVNRRETLDSDGIGALGAVGGAAAYSAHNAGVRRGPSNASSSYSAAGQSDNSGEYPGMPNNGQHEYYPNDSQGYYQSNPYGSHDPYATSPPQGQQPVIRDVSARRNTRIENPSVFPQQGNSGISQNF